MSNPGFNSGQNLVFVDVHWNSKGDATITFTAIGGGLGIIDGSSLGLNVNTADGWKGLFDPPSSNGEPLSLDCELTGCKKSIDGFGKFNLIFDQQDAAHPATTVSVELTGGGWTNAFQVLTPNGKTGSMAASHYSIDSCTFFAGNGTTGSPTTCKATPPVPEPSSLILLGSGLIGMGTLVRRKVRC